MAARFQGRPPRPWRQDTGPSAHPGQQLPELGGGRREVGREYEAAVQGNLHSNLSLYSIGICLNIFFVCYIPGVFPDFFSIRNATFLSIIYIKLQKFPTFFYNCFF